MLSVRRRQDDARGVALRGAAAAAGGMEDDAELEEGEAFGDETAFVDPDVALSCIDEKLQDVLGHFQKDFEGGVSAENLGSKFDEYGSFLPTYQRSPLPQTRSPPKAACVSSRSPYHQPIEGMSQNPLPVAVPSVSKNTGSMGAFSDDSIKKEIRQSTKVERSSSTHDSLNGPSKSGDHNRFKVRIKVGSDNVLARNNAAIYSGLGLDISSPSSIEDSPDGRGSLSPEFNNVPLESPQTILQGSLLQLTRNVVPASKNREINVNSENVQERYEGHVAKRVKSDAKKKKGVDTKKSKNRSDISAVMKNEIDIETPAGQKIVSEALNIPLLSNSRSMEAQDGSQFEEQRIGNTMVENKDVRLKERTINSDLITIKSENVKPQTLECLENNGFGSSEMVFSAVKGEVKVKAEKSEIPVEGRNTANEKDFQLDRKQERKLKTESKCGAAGVNFESNKVMNERTPAVSRSSGKISSKETLLNDINGENVSNSEVKRIHKEQNINASSSSDFLEDEKVVLSSAAIKERKNDLQSKSSHPGKKPKTKSHRDVGENLPEGSYGGKDLDTLENGSGFGELRQKEKKWKNGSERYSDLPGSSKREISSSLKHERHHPTEEQKMNVPSASTSTANTVPMLPAPVVIDEHWVCCDICQKWCLLPYEMNPSTLPKKWKCSMQQWLPGMNRCEVGEDETTNALNALYVIPAPGNGVPPVGHPYVASAGLATSSTLNVNGNVEQSRKRKNGPLDGNGSVEGSHPAQASVYTVSSQHAPLRSKSTVECNQLPIERYSKSVDHLIEKKRSKSKNRGSSSDGGHLMERSKKYSKVKSKREMDHDEYRSSKKIKKEERHHSGIDSNPGYVLASGDVPDDVKAFPANVISSERCDVPSSKHKNFSKYSSSEKSKRAKDGDIVLLEDKNKEQVYPSDVQRSDLSSKKRIVKEWEESQHNSTAQVSKGSAVNQSSLRNQDTCSQTRGSCVDQYSRQGNHARSQNHHQTREDGRHMHLKSTSRRRIKRPDSPPLTTWLVRCTTKGLLGSKFRGYGSFLPTYQRSPLPQTRSPPKAAYGSSRSPYHQPTEGMSQNPLPVAVPSVSKNTGSMRTLFNDSIKKEMRQSTKVERSTSTHNSLDGPSKSNDHNRFKVRIKVGSDNVLARNNAVIYSGLGLDISSPSSIEDSPDGRGSLSPEFNNVPLESPQTILQIMTCFSVPGEFLLSPLQGSLLQLTRKVVPASKNGEINVNSENVQERYEGHVAKRVKSDAKKKKGVDTKKSKNRSDISAVMKNEIDIETPAGQKIVSEALNIPLLSNSRSMEAQDGSQFEEQRIGNTLVENKDVRLKERTINSDLITINSENVKPETMECLENNGFGSSEMVFSAVKGEVKVKAEKSEIPVEGRNTANEKDSQLDRKQERKLKTESKCSAAGVNFESNKVMNERTPAVSRSSGKVSSKETLLNDINGENVSNSEVKRIHKEQNVNASSSSDFLEDEKVVLSSAAVKERKNDLQSKSSHPGKKPKTKSHRDVGENLPEGSYGGKDLDTLENGSGFGELRQKEKKWKNGSERYSDLPGSSKREISSSLKHERHHPTEEQKMNVPSASTSTANTVPMLPAPVVIDEHWVCCDICQKWRLLPYEMNPSTLPKKWKCSMQQWLPGMNRCEVSEDETTNALNALYVIPAPGNGVPPVGHPYVASAGLATSSTLNGNGNVEQSRKRKNGALDGNGSVQGSHPAQASVYTVSSQHAPLRSKSTAECNQIPIERDSKSVDHLIEKKRSKSKNHGSSSDGGHLMERSKKYSKVKSKRDGS